MTTKAIALATPDTGEARYRPRIEAMKAEIDRILRGLRRRRAKIDKLRERTRGRLAQLKEFTR